MSLTYLDLGIANGQKKTNFSFTAQSLRLAKLLKKINLVDIDIIAHDTGASIARILATTQPNLIKKLVLLNTEIPNHRPPFIPYASIFSKVTFR